MNGWDWGPIMPDAGIWKDIYLIDGKQPRITDVRILQRHDEGRVFVSVKAETSIPADVTIKVIAPNGSGVGGAASFHVQGKGSESPQHLAENFPHWFSSSFNKAVADDTLTIDMIDAFCVIAPRAVLRTEAKNDAWANPDGVLAIRAAMDPVYELLGVDTAYNQVVVREGDHGHTLADWNTLIDFCDSVFH